MRLKQALHVFTFSLIFLLLLGNSQTLFQDKWVSLSNTFTRVKFFYKEKQNSEVVFIGSSHVHYNINPLQIFNQGITSYDFSSPSQDFSASKLYMEEVFRVEMPKVITIDALNMEEFVNSEVQHRHRKFRL